jgi:5,10-methenyltetrahydrofolate synthetase
MAQEPSEKIKKRIQKIKSSGVITYLPFLGEVDPEAYIPFSKNTRIHLIQPDRSLDPFIEAEKVKTFFTDHSPIIFVPGRKFDTAGTRHGRGGGWYDRFLSTVPSTWIRIGFCHLEQLSETPLVRESWDMPMHFVCAISKTSEDFKFIRA